MGVAQVLRLGDLAAAPLRRPRQPVADHRLRRHGRTAALARRSSLSDAALFSIISAFDAAYAAYNGFQNGHRALLDAALGRSRTASPSSRPR